MIGRGLLGLVVFLAFAPICLAHYLWVVVDSRGDGRVANIYFEESPNPGDGSYMDHFLGKEKTWIRTLTEPDPEPLNAKEVKKDDKRWMNINFDGDVECSVDVYGKFGVYQYPSEKVLLHYYARSLQVHSHDAIHELGRAERMNLDLVPHDVGNKVELTLLWKGEPVRNRMVFMRGPERFRQNLETDERGRVVLVPKSPGQYTIRSSKEELKSGEESGEKYQSVRHNITMVLKLPFEG